MLETKRRKIVLVDPDFAEAAVTLTGFVQAEHFLRLFVCRVEKSNDNKDRDGHDDQDDDDDSNVNEDGLLMLSHSCASSTRLRQT